MQLIPLAFGVGFYLHLDEIGFNATYPSDMLIYLGFVGVLAFLFFAPYLTKPKTDNTLYYQYFCNLGQVFLFGIVL
ncbi:MAG: hypothetical protein LBH96_02925 [Candidatus Peribacteria bacterium]|nr:hypothetical protein [Candidatus Peribacteria bacterium]